MKKFLLPFIHNQLISLDVTGNLSEDELVADWHDAHSNYQDWCRAPIVKRQTPEDTGVGNVKSNVDDTTDVSIQPTLNIKE